MSSPLESPFLFPMHAPSPSPSTGPSTRMPSLSPLPFMAGTSSSSAPVKNRGPPTRISSSPPPLAGTSSKPVSVKKRGRPTKQKDLAEAKKPRWLWGKEDVEALLKLRYQDARLVAKFKAAKSKKQKTAAWGELTLRFNGERLLSQTVIQLQKKMDKLLAEYREIKHGMIATGNDVASAPKLPDYWATLTECLQARKALSGDLLGESADGEVETSESEQESGQEGAGEEIHGKKSETKQKGRLRGPELMANALENGMNSLANALSGQSNQSPSVDNSDLVSQKLDNLLVGIEKLQQIQQSNVEGQEKLNNNFDRMIGALEALIKK